MRWVFAALLCVSFQAHAQAPDFFSQPGIAIVGPGCTTAVYYDPTCSPCAVGEYVGGTTSFVTTPTQPSSPTGYQYVQSPPSSSPGTPFYSVSDTMPADPTMPGMCTTAQWEAATWTYNGTGYSWNGAAGNGALENDAMLGFLCQRKGWCPASPTVYYLSQSGSDSTGAANDPTHPYLTPSKILNLIVSASYPGDIAIIVMGGQWGQTWTNPGLIFTPGITYNNWGSLTSVTNPSYYISGIAGHPDYIMNFPGEVVETDYGFYEGSPGAYYPHYSYGWITWDGLKFYAPSYDNGNSNGDGMFFSYDTDVVVKYCEFVGWDKIAFGDRSVNPTIEYNIFHEMFNHSLYFLSNGNYPWQGNGTTASGSPTVTITATTFGTTPVVGNYLSDASAYIPASDTVTAVSMSGGTGTVTIGPLPATGNSATGENLATSQCDGFYAAEVYPDGDFNFALDNTNYVAGKLPSGCGGASYSGRVIGNIAYSTGRSGNDAFHLNTRMLGAVVTGNIISYSGGSTITLQTGMYGSLVSANLAFDSGDACYLDFLYGDQANGNMPTLSASSSWNTWSGDLCWSGATTDTIRGTTPGEGLSLYDKTGIHHIAYTVLNNDVFVTADNTGGTGNTALDFEQDSYPDETTIKNSDFWYTGNQTTCRAYINTAASPNYAWPAGAYNFSSWTTAPTTGINTAWSGNTCADPSVGNTGWNASETIVTSPWEFSFGTYNLH